MYTFPPLPYQCTVDCGMWKGAECKVWSVKKVESYVEDVVCRLEWGLWSAQRKVQMWGGKCEVV